MLAKEIIFEGLNHGKGCIRYSNPDKIATIKSHCTGYILVKNEANIGKRIQRQINISKQIDNDTLY